MQLAQKGRKNIDLSYKSVQNIEYKFWVDSLGSLFAYSEENNLAILISQKRTKWDQLIQKINTIEKEEKWRKMGLLIHPTFLCEVWAKVHIPGQLASIYGMANPGFS